jgi:GNAT superfamily N-acetyltransferase
LVCIPDIYQQHINGGIDRARIISIGAIPEYRNKGVGVLMGAHLMANLLKNPSYMSVEGSMILGQNVPVHNLVKRFGAQPGKEYWLLEKALP